MDLTNQEQYIMDAIIQAAFYGRGIPTAKVLITEVLSKLHRAGRYSMTDPKADSKEHEVKMAVAKALEGLIEKGLVKDVMGATHNGYAFEDTVEYMPQITAHTWKKMNN